MENIWGTWWLEGWAPWERLTVSFSRNGNQVKIKAIAKMIPGEMDNVEEWDSSIEEAIEYYESMAPFLSFRSEVP